MVRKKKTPVASKPAVKKVQEVKTKVSSVIEEFLTKTAGEDKKFQLNVYPEDIEADDALPDYPLWSAGITSAGVWNVRTANRHDGSIRIMVEKLTSNLPVKESKEPVKASAMPLNEPPSPVTEPDKEITPEQVQNATASVLSDSEPVAESEPEKISGETDERVEVVAE